MSLNREAIYQALFSRLQALPNFNTTSRRWVIWDDVSSAEQPALYLPHGNEQVIQERGRPVQWKLQPTIWIYARTDHDPTSAPGATLSQLIQAVEAALERQPNEQGGFANPDSFGTTLGGLCSHCWIAGPIVTDEGVLGGQAVAQIPLEILATA